MISLIAFTLICLASVFAQVPYPYSGAYKTATVVPQANVVTVSPTPKYYSPQPTAYVASPPTFVPVQAPAVASAAVVAPKFRSGIADKDAQIVSEGREVSFDGTFNYGFDSDNGISVKSKGYVKPAPSPTDEPIQVIEGSYTFVDAYGNPQTIQYIADENGYRAFGDAIPQPSAEILKSLAHRRR